MNSYISLKLEIGKEMRKADAQFFHLNLKNYSDMGIMSKNFIKLFLKSETQADSLLIK